MPPFPLARPHAPQMAVPMPMVNPAQQPVNKEALETWLLQCPLAKLGGGFKHPWGFMIQFDDSAYFLTHGLVVQPPTRNGLVNIWWYCSYYMENLKNRRILKITGKIRENPSKIRENRRKKPQLTIRAYCHEHSWAKHGHVSYEMTREWATVWGVEHLPLW